MHTKFNFFKRDQLNLRLAKIPLFIKEFNLSNITVYSENLGDSHLKADELITIINAPIRVESINLSMNSLGGYYDGRRPFTTNELITIIKALPSNLTTLDLSHNYLHHLSGDDLVSVINALPPGLKCLNLSSNGFEKYSSIDLVKILKALPANLLTLKLDSNLKGFSAVELISILQASPENLTSLSLKGNDLYSFTAPERIEIIKALPKLLNSLDLGWNFNLRAPLGNELLELFNVLPINLVSLGWSGNGMNRLSPQEIQTAFSILCATNLASLYLSGNQLNDNQVSILFELLATSKITMLEMKNEGTGTHQDYKGLGDETISELKKILLNNQNKALLKPLPDEQGLFGLKALCGRAITLFKIPVSPIDTPSECLRVIEQADEMVKFQGLKL